jgi:hypothetical protein
MDDDPALIFWTDGSCYEHFAVTGIAVVDHRTALRFGNPSSLALPFCIRGRVKAVDLAFRLCRYLPPQQIEVRSDCRPAIEALATAPGGSVSRRPREVEQLSKAGAEAEARQRSLGYRKSTPATDTAFDRAKAKLGWSER